MFLQSSGKSRLADTGHSTPVVTSKPVILTGSGGSQFALPRSSGSGAVRTLAHSVTTSSQTLRSLLSSTLENLPVSQTMILTPLKKTVNTSNSYQTLVQPPPATDTVTLTLDDIMTITPATGHRTLVQTAGSVSSVTASDRESDLTSPGSVRSEATDTVNGRSDDMGDLSHQSDKLLCQFPGCACTFDRPNLLKRHQKIHSGECRFDEIMTIMFSELYSCSSSGSSVMCVKRTLSPAVNWRITTGDTRERDHFSAMCVETNLDTKVLLKIFS